jgi:protein-tyrosine phosphatase
MIDLHAHILPGIDDGARNLDESLDMCRMAARDAITTIVATPHSENGGNGNSREVVLSAVAKLQNEVDKNCIPVRLLPGSDARIRQDLFSLIENGSITTVNNNGRYVMIEFPKDIVPPNWVDWLFETKLKGITPVFTHPERHRAIQTNPFLIVQWVNAGGLVQITAMSLTGQFGPEAEKSAKYLLSRHLVHAIATDAHSANGRPPVLSKAVAVASYLVGFPYVHKLVKEFPEAIIAGRSIELPQPISVKKEYFSGFRTHLSLKRSGSAIGRAFRTLINF